MKIKDKNRIKRRVQTLDQLQREQLASIGGVLRQTREEQSLSLEQLSSKTLIRPSLMSAIESANLEQLPEPVYVRGLIKRYADILGLDGETLAIQFFTHLNLRSRSSWKDSPAAQLRPLHLYTLYILLVMFAVGGLSYVLKRTTPEFASIPAIDPLVTVGSDGAGAPQPTSNPNNYLLPETSILTPSNNRPIRVEVILTGQSWMRVIADGQKEFEGILQQGDTRVWTADEKLTMRAGNAGGVLILYNNKAAEKLGEPGNVAEITFLPTDEISMNF